MSATEPIDTRTFPLEHELIEDWQRIAADAENAPATGAAAKDGEAAGGATDSAPGEATETTTAFAELGSIAGVDYGLWEMSVGAMRDIEGEEVFLVIDGTGRIEFDDPEQSSIGLAPGSLVRLTEGMKTRWYIDDGPLRKLFIAPTEE
ncbi:MULTISPECIES: cupin domain-containing protein [Brevibacterium]|uniref:(S)-ureidoglycine aminohydrolase cupin domain-containing protein n=1 Tax=Brevibacterium ammoniilyticum TaxID=1046555 RepID=A0ABP9U285_9MICO